MAGGRSLSRLTRNLHPPPAAVAAEPSRGSLDPEARAKTSGRQAYQQVPGWLHIGIEAAGPHPEEDTGQQEPVDHMVVAELDQALAADIASVAGPWPGPDIPGGRRPAFPFRRTRPLDHSSVVEPLEDLHRLRLRLSYDTPPAVAFVWFLVLEIYPEPSRAFAEPAAIPERPLAAALPIPLHVGELQPFHKLFVARPGLPGLDSNRIEVRLPVVAAQPGLAADIRHTAPGIVRPAAGSRDIAWVLRLLLADRPVAGIAPAAIGLLLVLRLLPSNIAADNPGATADSRAVAETAPRPAASRSVVSSSWKTSLVVEQLRPVAACVAAGA